MKLLAYCIGISKEEIESLGNVKIDGNVNITTENQLTTIKAKGSYDELLQLVVEITKFKIFEVHLN